MPLVATPAGKWVNAFDLASQWLHAIGLPNTPTNQRALAAWFMAESKRSGNNVYVVGNNPLNITTSSGNYRLVGTHRIAVYQNETAGISAFNSLIRYPHYGYPAILSALQKDSGVVQAIIRSGWVTGSTTSGSYWSHNHTVNGLINIWNGLSNGTSQDISIDPSTLPNAGDGHTSDGNPSSKTLATLFGIDPNTVLTITNVQGMIDKIPSLGLSPVLAEALKGTLTTIMVGLTLNPTTIKAGDIAISDNGSATGGGYNLNTQDQGFLGINTALAYLGKTVPAIMAIIGGGLGALFGLYLITKEATNSTGAGESLVSPVPVFIRDRM